MLQIQNVVVPFLVSSTGRKEGGEKASRRLGHVQTAVLKRAPLFMAAVAHRRNGQPISAPVRPAHMQPCGHVAPLFSFSSSTQRRSSRTCIVAPPRTELLQFSPPRERQSTSSHKTLGSARQRGDLPAQRGESGQGLRKRVSLQPVWCVCARSFRTKRRHYADS